MALDPATDSLIRFRAMELEDLDTVVENELHAYEFPWTRGIFRECLRDHECRVVHRPGAEPWELLGHGVLSCGAGEGHLLNVCVRRDEQGNGLGRALVVHMLDRAVARGAKRLFLEVRPSNMVARGLYESLGFVEIGVRRNYYPSHLGNEDANVLAMDLRNHSRRESV